MRSQIPAKSTTVAQLATLLDVNARLVVAFEAYPHMIPHVLPLPVHFFRSSRKLGSARFRGGKPHDMRISTWLRADSMRTWMVDTFLHEVAHLIVSPCSMPGEGHHGERWKACMRSMDLEPNVTATPEESAALKVVMVGAGAVRTVAACEKCGATMERSRRMTTTMQASFIDRKRYHRGCGGAMLLV